MNGRDQQQGGTPVPAPNDQPKAPKWLQPLLYMAAEQLAMRWNQQAASVEFKAYRWCPLAETAKADTYVASLVSEPVGTRFRLQVFHKATGRAVCRSLAVALDDLDGEAWETDLIDGTQPA